jgi:dienelactone hydrolase
MLGRLTSIAWVAVLLLASGSAIAEGPPLWGGLAPGPFAVGFRSTWELDPSRTYNFTFADKTKYAEGKAPRPILVNLWYPAERTADARAMPHGGYFEIPGGDAGLAKLAGALADYERGVVAQELLGKPPSELDEPGRKLLDRLWATPTACLREARPLDRKGAVVVYHCGAGSSFEDNAVLCEYLASHGYVVLGAPFQQASGTTLNIDGLEGSARDMAYLIGYASRLPFADWNHVAIAGHSAGAQISLIYASKGATPVDAVVSLDTTQDYYSLSEPGWKTLVSSLKDDSRNMTMPILYAANAYALFELADTLEKSDRDYLTFKDLDHNDFISQGIFKHTVESWADPGKAAAPAPGSPKASYEALCGYVLAFLDAQLRGDRTRLVALDATYRRNPIGGTDPHVEHVPIGVKAATAYQDAPGRVPEPRQVWPLLKDRGAEAVVALLKAAHEESPGAPIFHENLGLALVGDLLAKGRTPDALAFNRLYTSFDPTFRGRFARIGKSYLKYGMKTLALAQFEKAVALDPDDAESAGQVKALREALKAP